MMVLPEDGLLVADVSVIHPAANNFVGGRPSRQVRRPPAQDAAKRQKYGSSGQVAGGSFTILSMEL
jgi:hypothetical protein